MASQLSRKRVVDSPDIPDRLYFKIGDVARICAVEPYVLRFWETQFPQLKPNKSGTGQRLYRRREVELALEIKRLVHGEGYTLSGARHALGVNQRRVETRPAAAPEPSLKSSPELNQAARRPDSFRATVGNVRSELREILSLLSNHQPRPPRQRARLLSVSPDSGSLFPL
jgi:DNA-binding transcriptional MerR regulator